MNHSTLRWGILSSAARGRAPFGSEMFFVRGVALETTAGTTTSIERRSSSRWSWKSRSRSSILKTTGPERQVAGHRRSGFAAAHTPSGRCSIKPRPRLGLGLGVGVRDEQSGRSFACIRACGPARRHATHSSASRGVAGVVRFAVSTRASGCNTSCVGWPAPLGSWLRPIGIARCVTLLLPLLGFEPAPFRGSV